jgi:hypothetical protein
VAGVTNPPSPDAHVVLAIAVYNLYSPLNL